MQNKDQVADLALLEKVDSDSLCGNLERRYLNDLIYCSIGEVIISVNPFKKLDIYDTKVIERYM